MSNTVSKGRKITAKFDGRCPACEASIVAGTEVVFYADHRPGRKCLHVDCARAQVLEQQIFALGLKSLQDDFNETYWLGRQKAAELELAGHKATIAARLAA